MRKIVISDIHGHLDEFLKLLALTKYQKDKDELYLLGDYVDKGKQAKEVIQFIMQLLDESPFVHVLAGNHDDMFLNWLENKDYYLSPYTNEKNSGTNTILSFAPFFIPGINDEEVKQMIKETYSKEINFLKNLPYYFEDDRHIYVHAGIDPAQKEWRNTSKKKFRWIREEFYRNLLTSMDKTVIFGHTCCAVLRDNYEDFSVWFSKGKIGIDGGTKFNGQLNALVIEENGEYSTYYVKTPSYNSSDCTGLSN